MITFFHTLNYRKIFFNIRQLTFRYYAHGWRREGNWIPLYKRGDETIKQPVFVGNVATGIANAIKDADADGKTFQGIG